MGLDQERLQLHPPPCIAADRERAESIAVIALPLGDDMTAPGLANLDKILARHLERGLDRLRPAADQIGVAHPRRRDLDQAIGETFGGLGGEEAGVGVGEGVELPAYSAED